ncbi:hypothetical protein Tco_1326857 [Tanacetum coccineum]
MNDPLHHEFAGEVITLPPRIEEIDIFSGPDDSIPPGIESDFDSEEDIIDNLLNDDPIPEYEHLTFDMEPDVPVINNEYELNEDEYFDPGGGEINVVVDDSLHLFIRTFSHRNASCSMIPNGYGNNESQNILGTDNANITRKRSKPDKHGHENG